MGEELRQLKGNMEEEVEAEASIWKYIFGFVETAVVKCAIDLTIADAIESHGSSMTLSQLSSTLGCDPALLFRLMRFLIQRKIFKEVPSNHGSISYAQSPLSRRLTRNGKQSMAAFVLLESSPVMLGSKLDLSARVLANSIVPFEKSHGGDVWSYAAANLDYSQLVNEAMACDARLAVPAIIEGCAEAFDAVGTVVDVGGGNGTAMGVLVKALPWIHAINFDLPHVVSEALKCDGVENVGGDMFLSVPKADTAFLMWVLHDWGDEECIKILKKCREAIPKKNGKVIIVEAVIEEGNDDKFKDVKLMIDMVMLAHTNYGKERTMKEWEYVIKEAGFSRYTVKSIHSVKSVIMAFS